MNANIVFTKQVYYNANSLNIRKKEHITKKAKCLFSLYGIQRVSMSDIANHCKVSKKTIYTFWDSKELLLTEIVALVLAENSKAFDDIQTNSLCLKVEIQELFYILQRTIKVLTRNFIGDLREHYPNTYLLLCHFHDKKLRPFLVQNLKRGIEEAVYRSNFDSELLSILYCWQLQNIYEARSIPINSYKLLNQINELFLQRILCNIKDAL